MPYRDFLTLYPECIEDQLVLGQKTMDLATCDVTNLGDYSQPSHPLVWVCLAPCGPLLLGTPYVRRVHAGLLPVLFGCSAVWTYNGRFIHSPARAQWSHVEQPKCTEKA